MLRTWLAIHKPLAVAFSLDAALLMPDVVRRGDPRMTKRGVMLHGEVCHLGPVSLDAVIGCLFVTASTLERYEFLPVINWTMQVSQQ